MINPIEQEWKDRIESECYEYLNSDQFQKDKTIHFDFYGGYLTRAIKDKKEIEDLKNNAGLELVNKDIEIEKLKAISKVLEEENTRLRSRALNEVMGDMKAYYLEEINKLKSKLNDPAVVIISHADKARLEDALFVTGRTSAEERLMPEIGARDTLLKKSLPFLEAILKILQLDSIKIESTPESSSVVSKLIGDCKEILGEESK